MIYKNISFSNFVDGFVSMNRVNQFSYEALELIYDYLTDIDFDIEFDVIAICCDYTEESVEDYFKREFDKDCIAEVGDDYEEKERLVLDYLEKNTFVIGVTGNNTVVYCEF